MLPVDSISGLILSKHRTVDAASKERAKNSLYGWEKIDLSPSDWIKALESGSTIQPSLFKPKPDGSYSHKLRYWKSTHFICADGDNFRGVETFDDGTEKNPHGIPCWTKIEELGDRFPELKNTVYAVGQSVSSMSEDKPPAHRRYRLIFLFDKPIEKEEHYSQIILALAKDFPIIPTVDRYPAQPVFGNARKGTNEFSTCGNILSLDDYSFQPEQPTQTPEMPQGASKDSIPTQTLLEYLNTHSIENAPTPKHGKYFVVCPRRESHTGNKQGRTDSYVWEDSKGWGFYCSHTSCANHRTWEAFRTGNGIKKSEFTERKPPAAAAPEPGPAPEVEHDPVMPVDTEIQAPVFPDSEGEHFPGVFQDLYQAYAHSHVLTAPAIMAMGIAAVGHAAGRRVIIKSSEQSSEKVFLNTYTLLIGRSDLTAKSDTREELNALLKLVYHREFYPVTDVQSIEGIIRAMETEQDKHKDENPGTDFYDRKGYFEGSRMFVMLDEIATLFANARREGTKNLLSAINKFWKCPAVERVARAKCEQIVEYPVLSVWGNITPEQVVEYLQGLDMTGGTINRFMPFFITPKVETIRHPHPVVEDYTRVVQCLQIIADSRQQRTLIFSTEADDARFDWFSKQRAEHLASEDDKGETRFHTTAVKIAGIFALADNSESEDIVELHHWNDALAVTRYLIESYNFSFRDVGSSKLSKLEHKILEVLNSNGNDMTLTDLSKNTRTVDTKTRLEVIESLQQSGQVQTYAETTSGRKKLFIKRIGE